MVNVCACYCGVVILLTQCETIKEAEEFMKNDYVLHYADELEDCDEDELIYKDEMFIEDELPFFEPIGLDNVEWDDLPY